MKEDQKEAKSTKAKLKYSLRTVKNRIDPTKAKCDRGGHV